MLYRRINLKFEAYEKQWSISIWANFGAATIPEGWTSRIYEVGSWNNKILGITQLSWHLYIDK